MSSDVIPDDWLVAITAAMAKWMQTTEGGLQFGARLFHFELERGRRDVDYIVSSSENCPDWASCLRPESCSLLGDTCLRSSMVERTVGADNVWFYQGAIVEKRPTGLSAIEIRDKEKKHCSSCSIVSHCVKEFSVTYSETTNNAHCNFCAVRSQNPRIQQYGDLSLCETCTVTRCENHPFRQH
ncbi:MAG: hypothetical protein MUP21_02730 [Dehalococcoidia bacterium]|nr:hypothetical protein [Dehalococcoidia bacterium]